MSSLAYNLKRKLEWLGRRLRWIDAPGEIVEWVAAMREVNNLLKEVQSKRCSDDWQPWCKREGGVKKDLIDGKPRSWRLSGRISVPESKKVSMEPDKNRHGGIIPKLFLNDRLLKDVSMDGSKVSTTPMGLPPRVEVELDDPEMKTLQASNWKSKLWEEATDNDGGNMDVDILR